MVREGDRDRWRRVHRLASRRRIGRCGFPGAHPRQFLHRANWQCSVRNEAIVPTRETEPAKPICPYGISKLAAETYAQWFRRSRGLDIVTLRFGNVYGARQDPAHGAVVARFCDQAVRGPEFEIFGTGDATRDYVYVAEAVAASLTAGQRGQLNYCIYNVSSGQETSVRQLAHLVAVAAGRASGNMNIKCFQLAPAKSCAVAWIFPGLAMRESCAIRPRLIPVSTQLSFGGARHSSGAKAPGDFRPKAGQGNACIYARLI